MKKIASKVAKILRKEAASSLVSLEAYKESRRYATEAAASIRHMDALIEKGYQPVHAAYLHTQNLLSVLLELLLMLPALDRFNQALGTAEEEYMPSGPPQSSVTTSYFVSWSSFDLAIGLQKETLTSITLDLKDILKLSPEIVSLMEYFNQSRMGIYEHSGFDQECIRLRDINTQRSVSVFNPSGYRGTPGELWFVRLLPNPVAPEDKCICFTTPYVLTATRSEWEAFFQRGVWRKQQRWSEEQQLKYGLTPCSWMEYIHQAYLGINNEFTAIFLAGVPDLGRTRPHFSAMYPARLPEASGFSGV